MLNILFIRFLSFLQWTLMSEDPALLLMGVLDSMIFFFCNFYGYGLSIDNYLGIKMYKAFKKIMNVIMNMFNEKNDPIKHCDVYKKLHYVHVDGYLCDMKTCSIYKEFKERNLCLI